MKPEIRMDVLERMFTASSSNKFLLSALKSLIPKRNKMIRYVLAIFFSIIPSYLMAISQDTILMFRNCVQIMNDVVLAMFGIVFTGYALFQALIGREMLIRMLQNTVTKNGKEESKLQESNELFAETMMMEFFAIVISVALLVVLNSLPENYSLFQNMAINNIIAGCGMGLYFYILFIAFIETKSFIYNIVQLFNFHAGTRVLELLREDDKEK